MHSMFGGCRDSYKQGVWLASPPPITWLCCAVLASVSSPLALGSVQQASWHVGLVYDLLENMEGAGTRLSLAGPQGVEGVSYPKADLPPSSESKQN